ncbi:MAG: Mov34/MPN/PAD-1 family protein [Anaerolineales bacterium]
MEDKKYPIQTRVPGPRRAKMPLHRARRWLAEGENGRSAGIQVFLTQQAYLRINAHAASDLDNEVGGWLAGRWCKDTETGKEFVVVEALLPAQQVRSGSTFLTFTHDSQVAMLAALEERYSKKGVVGWYHTHPRMGIFLSGYDTWLHDHFFPHPWQVALVVEPHTGVGGFFVRNKDNKLDARKYYGFYELQNRRVESVVEWENLHLEKPKEKKKGEARKADLTAAPKARPEQQIAKPAEAKAPTAAKPAPTRVEVKSAAIKPPPTEPKLAETQKPEVRKIDPKPEPPKLLAASTAPKPVEPTKPEVKRVAVRKKETKSTLDVPSAAPKPVEESKADVKRVELNSNESQNPQEKKQEIRIDVHNKTIVKEDPKNGTKSSEEAKS